ncbi:MAG: Na(+)-translocating NADH-quinone reductase subunit A [Myxococcota bacterium]|nr:Na(+)-translocating NADH-quinone reductase subunit A [Myxococcota bacterium]
MALHKIKKGLDLPITGSPEQTIYDGPQVDSVAIVATDFVGMKPKMLCRIGDDVQRGQPIFEDRKTPGVLHTAPGAGKLVAINRGARRVLESVVIELSEAERSGRNDEQISFASYSGQPVAELDREQIVALLVESGLWTAFRTRPYSKVPEIDSTPSSIFINTMDTRPLAADPEAIIAERDGDFQSGLAAIAKLSGRVYLCKASGSSVLSDTESVTVETFDGPHPAGLPGTHIHTLDPVSRKKTVWHINYQDILAVGVLFSSGQLDVRRVVSLAGPPVKNGRLLRTRMGANLTVLTSDEYPDGEHRIISGDVLSGRAAMGEVHGFLSRYDLQISVLKEDREREFIGWLRPGANKFTTVGTYLGGMLARLGGRRFAFTTTTHGEHREMVPLGMYEKVMPLDIIPTFLLRSILVEDTERAEKLGALELAPEDLGLCSFVCPGKQDYGNDLGNILETIRKEG